MSNEQQEPTDDDSIECHLQQIGMGTLVCRAARQRGDVGTNEVTPAVCFSCPVGKVFREVGCSAIMPKITIHRYRGATQADIESLFCKIRKRPTTLEYCQTCNLVTAETTRKIVTTARGLFEAQGFYSAYQDLEVARNSIRDGNFENAVTRSIACLESTMRICHEKLGEPLPAKKDVTGLWKSTRSILDFDAFDPSGSVRELMNALTGTVIHLGRLRNALGDAHGKGIVPPDVSDSIAELAINTASTLSTMVLRRFKQAEGAQT
jgi:hypothetical protein